MSEQNVTVSKDDLSSWPERIYLQRDWDCVDEGCAPHEETTWCAEKIHDVDVEYVRADIVEPRAAQPPGVEAPPGFVEGVAYALATLNKLHDQPGMCADVLGESGLCIEDFREVDTYDGAEIRKIFQQESFRIGNHKHVMALHDRRPRITKCEGRE